MAFIPDNVILHLSELSPAEIKVYSFYCKCRNKTTGGWKCADQYVAGEMKMSRNRVTEARNKLEKRGWISVSDDHFVRPLFGFEKVENSTIEEKDVENSTDKVENSTQIVENSTNKVENSTSPYKEDNQPTYQPINQTNKPGEREGARGNEVQQDEPAKMPVPLIELPADFEIDEEMRRWASENAPTVALDDELAEFTGYWRKIAFRNNRRTLTGWVATWKARMWALERRSPAALGARQAAAAGRNESGKGGGFSREPEKAGGGRSAYSRYGANPVIIK